jgi:hypothetical protein
MPISEAKEKQSGLTRRSFLKTTAAVAGTAALVGNFGCRTIGARCDGREKDA